MGLILSQQGSFGQNSNSFGCGTANKCSVCLYKLICDRSPFCCIKKETESCDFTPIINIISQLDNSISNELSNKNISIDNINNNIELLNNRFDEIVSYINSMNSKMDDILAKFEDSNIFYNNENIISNAEVLSENEKGIVPFENNNDPVLVQKKDIFGRTKWVEEKRK